MTNQNANPSVNPADNDSLVGMMRQVLGKFLLNVDDMIPARVVAFDRAQNRVQVQPLIKMVTTSGDLVSRSNVASVPVFQLSGGGFVLNFPLKSGDYGWLKANDRDISLFLQSYSEEKPNTFRKHSFEDGVFFPDIMRGYTIASEDSDNVVLQNYDGSVRISLFENKVKITAPTIEMNTTTLAVTGTITAGVDVITNGISLKTHLHSGVMSGGSNTGGPI